MEPKKLKILIVFIIAIGVFTPLGLLPKGSAWGEWGKDELVKLIGFVPLGIRKFGELWKAPLQDYTFKNLNPVFSYVISAFLGAVTVAILSFLLLYRHRNHK